MKAGVDVGMWGVELTLQCWVEIVGIRQNSGVLTQTNE